MYVKQTKNHSEPKVTAMYQSYGSQGAYGGDPSVEEYEDEEELEIKKQGQLSCWGNQQSMNLNPLILTNITGSPYFKVQLFNIKVSVTKSMNGELF